MDGKKTEKEAIAKHVYSVEPKMALRSNATSAMNGSVKKLLNLIKEIINQHTHAYA